jgi:hypothetical protein
LVRTVCGNGRLIATLVLTYLSPLRDIAQRFACFIKQKSPASLRGFVSFAQVYYWFLFRLRLLAFPFALVDFMPAVFLLPLLFVTTAVFDETVLLFVFDGMLTFVSTTPSRGGSPTLLFVFARLEFVSVEPHPARPTAPPSTNARAKVFRIFFFISPG